MKLTIELVPSTSWYSNVRSNVTAKEWSRLSKRCYALAGDKCEVCGGSGREQGRRHAVECHEVWEYDDDEHTQTLVGLISLCPRCHMVKHAGLAQIKGKLDVVYRQLCVVNGISMDKARRHFIESMELWSERSKFGWTLDITYLDSYR